MFAGGSPDAGRWESQALAAWAICATQIRVAPMGGVIGLDYAGCEAVLGVYGWWDPEVITGLRIVEQEFIKWTAERAEAEAGHSSSRRGRRGLLGD